MAKIRVYELAKRLGRESKEVLYDLQASGANVRSASSEVAPEAAEQLEAVYRRGILLPKTPPPPMPFQDNNPLKVPPERLRDRIDESSPGRPPRPLQRPATPPPSPQSLTNRIGDAWPAAKEAGPTNESSGE